MATHRKLHLTRSSSWLLTLFEGQVFPSKRRLFADEKVVILSTQQIQDSCLHKGVLITLWSQLSGANRVTVSSRLAQPYHLLPMPRLPL
jgi:hypothetical protein